jgi:hypothetical protein
LTLSVEAQKLFKNPEIVLQRRELFGSGVVIGLSNSAAPATAQFSSSAIRWQLASSYQEELSALFGCDSLSIHDAGYMALLEFYSEYSNQNPR